MSSRLATLLCLTSISAAANFPQPGGDHAPRIWLVTLSAEVDGSGVFHFSDEALTYRHKHWSAPMQVTFNGTPWHDLSSTPDAWRENHGLLDLSQAWVVRRQGRDTVSLEKTKTGLSVSMVDSPNGSAPYSITIAIPMLEQSL